MTFGNGVGAYPVELPRPAQGSIQLLPSGRFQATDGRAVSWFIDSAAAGRVMHRFAARKNPAPIDYEHQTLNAAKNGLPAPAAGWFAGLEWIDDVGLFATSVTWTDAAKRQIMAGEYRYISPVFRHDPKTGEVLDVLHAGLTNVPALDGMAPVQYAAAARRSFEASPEEREVSRLLGLPVEEIARVRQDHALAAAKATHLGSEDADATVCRLLWLRPGELERTRATLGSQAIAAAKSSPSDQATADATVCRLLGLSRAEFEKTQRLRSVR
ncbi:hypothetical protein EWI61_00110 [Methylolobus aquaticus]|nr:hypothetical protein EWI61_00110 [Methylolobus aquaticus]